MVRSHRKIKEDTHSVILTITYRVIQGNKGELLYHRPTKLLVWSSLRSLKATLKKKEEEIIFKIELKEEI